MFKQPSTIFILRLVTIGRGIVSLMRITEFYIITRFKVSSSGYTRHYTELCSRRYCTKRMISPGHRELVVLKRSHEKHLVVGSGPVPYILRA